MPRLPDFAFAATLHRLACAALCLFTLHAPLAQAWGPEGHATVAEIAQRRLTPAAALAVERALGRGASLASIASWADDVREQRPQTANWHFVNIPRGALYEGKRDCAAGPRGDCIVAALERARGELCAADENTRRDALRYAVHFVGDIHQPLHAVGDERGGNGLMVQVDWRGLACTGRCNPKRTESNFHVVWDSLLITSTVWSFGAYVSRLEEGWLRTPEAQAPATAAGSVAEWADASHATGREVWEAMAPSRVLDDTYYRKVLPVLDRQLGLAGLRLARFLNEAYAAPACAAP